jgi:hypothetical protein
LNKDQLEKYISDLSQITADIDNSLNAAKKRLLTLKTTKDSADGSTEEVSLESRLAAWLESGVKRDSKTLHDFKGTAIAPLLSDCMNDGCVARHETKTVDCIVDIIFDYNGEEKLTPKYAKMVECLMEHNVGEVTFD